jgi:hypothetical protein
MDHQLKQNKYGRNYLQGISDEILKANVVATYLNNTQLKYVEIADICQCSPSFVRKSILHFFNQQEKKLRKTKFTEDCKRYIDSIFEVQADVTLKEVKNYLAEDLKINVALSTLSRHINKDYSKVKGIGVDPRKSSDINNLFYEQFLAWQNLFTYEEALHFCFFDEVKIQQTGKL